VGRGGPYAIMCHICHKTVDVQVKYGQVWHLGVCHLMEISYFRVSMSQCATRPTGDSRVGPRQPRMEKKQNCTSISKVGGGHYLGGFENSGYPKDVWGWPDKGCFRFIPFFLFFIFSFFLWCRIPSSYWTQRMTSTRSTT